MQQIVSPENQQATVKPFRILSRLTHSDLNSRQGRTTRGLNLGKFTQFTPTLTFFTEARVCGG